MTRLIEEKHETTRTVSILTGYTNAAICTSSTRRGDIDTLPSFPPLPKTRLMPRCQWIVSVESPVSSKAQVAESKSSVTIAKSRKASTSAGR
ncbi:hypothetical protein BH23CHL2_BH23CHL2_23150 [soil metagenome]